MCENIKQHLLSLTPALPDNFLQMCRDLNIWEHYLFVWRDPDTHIKTAYCTVCGKKQIIDVKYMKTVTNAQWELYNHRHNDACRCPYCGESVQYKDRNRGRGKLWQENYLYYFQLLPNGGLLLRTFYLHVSYRDMIDAQISYSEHQRIYFSQEKSYRMQRKVHCYEYADWHDRTQDGVWYMMATVVTPKPWTGRMCGCFKGCAMWAIEKSALTGDFRYSCLQEFLTSDKLIEYRDAPLYTVVEYLSLFQKNPSLIEKMMKQGLKPLLCYHLESQNLRFLLNFNKADFYSASQLNKADVRKITAQKDGFPMAKQLFIGRLVTLYGITAANAVFIADHDIYTGYHFKEWIKKIKDQTPEKVNRKIKYFRKQLITRFTDYNDYLKQLKELNMPITEENLFPHNFHESHQALTNEINRRATAKKRAAAMRMQKRFEKRYKKLIKDLFYEDEQFLIRPAKGDDELLTEGNALSHCVYTYRESYRAGKTVICFIRKKSNPEQPFYTLELSADYTYVIQCRGKGNCGTTPEVEAFKQSWFNWLQTKPKEETKTCRKTA